MTLPQNFKDAVSAARDAYLDSLGNPGDADKRSTYRALEAEVAGLLDLSQDQAFELIALRPIRMDVDRG